MTKSIHIYTARTMFNSGAPVDISVWKSDGFILELRNCISLRYILRRMSQNPRWRILKVNDLEVNF